MTRQVRVELGERSYDIHIGVGVLDEVGPAVAALPGARQAVVISDSTVAALYAPAALRSLEGAGLAATLVQFPAGEAHKTLATYGRLCDAVLAARPAIDRQTVIVALGGGVTGDMAGFLAATMLRGLRFVQCPTTLLADVDASVGGKTGVDHPAGKNMIGAFHQPSAVLIDVRTLTTLPSDELRGGLAECVKHGVIRDDKLLAFIKSLANDLLACDQAAMTELVTWNVAIKAAVVAADERESGVRAYLNFGHTIGHAIEATAGYGAMGHGQAVALGMAAACNMAAKRGLIEAAYAQRIAALLERLGLPTHTAGLDATKVLAVMRHDKKNRGGKIRMILPTAPGVVGIFDDAGENEILAAIETIRE